MTITTTKRTFKERKELDLDRKNIAGQINFLANEKQRLNCLVQISH